MNHTQTPRPGEHKASAPRETKSIGNAGSIKSLFTDFQSAFEEFKRTNDDRLSELEKRGSADPVTDQKLDRINNALTGYQKQIDELAAIVSRPGVGGDLSHGAAAQRKAFRQFLRTGAADSRLIGEQKALSGDSGAEGGYLLPDEIETMVGRSLAHITPMRTIATVRQIGAGTFKKPFATDAAATGWVGETASRPETDTPTLAEIEFPTAELYALPAATLALLDDASADVEAWLAEEIQTVFAEQEGSAFVNGTGSNQPTGFLSYTAVAESSWSWGNLGYVASGADGAFAATDPTDQLIDLVYTPKQGYRANANWMMNRKTEAAIRQFKDSDGNYIWRPGAEAGQRASLMGYPIVESEDMPDIASDSLSVAFGDFRRGYLIVDRVGIRILRDPYSAKPYVLFYATKRVGGGVQDFSAIKLMKFAAS